MTRQGTTNYGRALLLCALPATLIYTIMITVTLAHLEALAQLTPFDMRPFGYSAQDARALLSALGAEGRAYYLTRQIPLDTVYPALLAATLSISMRWLGTRVHAPWLVRAGLVSSVCAALFDYAENLGITAMILRWPLLGDWLVEASSLASVLKASCTIAALAILTLLGVLRLFGLKANEGKTQAPKPEAQFNRDISQPNP